MATGYTHVSTHLQARTQQLRLRRYIRAQPGDPLRIGAWESDLNKLASLPIISRATWRPAPVLPGPEGSTEGSVAKAGEVGGGVGDRGGGAGAGGGWWAPDNSRLDLEVLVEEQKKFWNSSVMVGTTTVCPSALGFRLVYARDAER
jgi:hypothetical protein